MPDYTVLYMHPEIRLHLIEENVRDYVIFVVDPEGHIASWNVGAERILGYTEQEAIGMDCAKIFTPEDRQKGAVEQERSMACKQGRAEDERWHLRKDGSRFWGNGIMTALKEENGALSGYVKILRDETERREAQEDRERAHAISLSQERQNAVLQERTRIAREIHDTLAQNLTAISIQLEGLKDVLHDDERAVIAHLTAAQNLTRQGLAEARRSVWALRPEVLEGSTLITALTRIAEETQAATPLNVRYAIEGPPRPLPSHVEDHLLRITQEAITNTLRHSRATELNLMLHFDDEGVTIKLQDNGVGFDKQQIGNGFGTMSMRERAESLGGRCSVDSEPGQGTRIDVWVPIG